MASSSSTTTASPPPPCKYDVFLSFRGEDTRENFTSHLYSALCRKKIKTFIDEELSRGDEISPALLKAIEGSKISVIVFSEDYAASKWCLNELVEILECKKTNGQIVIPVFYHVSPSDVRKQTGIFGDAFFKLEQQFREMAQKWKAVLTEATYLSGHESTKIRPEAKLVEVIVHDILKKLERIPIPSDLKGLVGLNSRIERITSLLCLGLPDVRIVGILGMGGIGKTTIAKALFNQISNEFDGKCFMENVREELEKGVGLVHLHKQVLSQLLEERLEMGGPNIPLYTLERLRRTKVFIILDDVNEFEQLKYLVGWLDGFCPGSRIVVTTRDKQVLRQNGVGDERIYEVERLNGDEALELFYKYAFRQNDCPQDLMVLLKRVVRYAEGNPLALEVLGSCLHQKSKQDWENALDNLKQISGSRIYKVLKISYEELNSEEKSIFLDIACFFKGEYKDHVTMLLDDPHYDVTHGLSILVDKSLITISSFNELQMHDLLQEMGREIVRQESIKEPNKRSRLWYYKDAYHVLKKNKGSDKIEGIFLDLSKTKDIYLASGAFLNMPNLRLLKFYVPVAGCEDVPITSSKVHLDQGLEWLPKELRYLHWPQYPLKSLPFDFKPKNLIELNLPYSRVVQLWEGKKKAFKLKSIDLSHSHCLTRMPDLSETPNLETTNLLNCTNLACVPSSIQILNHLSILCLKGCESLRSFPSSLHFVSPVSIDCSFCVNLAMFPQISGNIRKLDLRKTAIEEVPSSVESLTNLEVLRMGNCIRLKRLSTSICKLKSLLELYLHDCLNLKSFPEILEKMGRLRSIDLKSTAIKELPSSIENLEGLEKLILDDCYKLEGFPDNIGNLKSLRSITAHGSAITQLPSSIADSNKLKQLYVPGCRRLVSLPRFLSGLSSLVGLDLSDCALMEIPQNICCLSSLVNLDLSGNNFESLPASIGCLSSLATLDLSGNKFESLPASIKQLSQLRSLDLRNCNMLESLPEFPLCLNHLDARNCKRLQSLPMIPPCLEELDTSVLEKLFRHSNEDASARIHENLSMEFHFTSCLKLNEKGNNILADSQLRIQHMTIASLKQFNEMEYDEIPKISIFLPGSEIPIWFSNQSSGSSITIQLPHHCISRNLIGFAVCAVIEFEEDDNAIGGIFIIYYRFEASTLSETKQVDLFSPLYIEEPIHSDHLILGFNPCCNVGLPDSNHHISVSFEFFVESHGSSYKVKSCGVCPVYANPSQTKPPNTFTLEFAAGSEEECTGSRNLEDKAGTSGTSASAGSSDEEELEPSTKRICRGQINTP